MADKKGRGGKREGAGRPAQLKHPKRFEMSFECETIKEIDARTGKGGRSAFIRDAVQEKLNAPMLIVPRETFGDG